MLEVIADAFRFQADACERLGSPLSARLCRVGLADLGSGGTTARLLEHWDPALDPVEHAVALRVLGTAHRLVLLGEAPLLAGHYPSAGGEPGPGLEAAFLALLAERFDTFRQGLGAQVQTNETGRAALLHPGLSWIVDRTGLPVRLFEIGCAAGLNLRLDHFGYDLGGTRLEGEPFLAPEWEGPPPSGSRPEVVARHGCDVAPLDVTTPLGAATAESFVWPDMVGRFERMAAAVDVARRVPAELESARAGDWVVRRVRPESGAVTVLMHSVMWQYLPEDERRAIEAALGDRGSSATSGAPLAHLAFEPRFGDDGSWTFELVVEVWPGTGPRRLATAHPHGAWVRWHG